MADVEAAFALPPREALKFLRKKGFAPSFAWQDVFQEEHRNAFTVAKMMDLDLLRDVRDAVDKALAEGLTLKQFTDNLQPVLFDAGWWGRKEVVDPDTGEIKVAELGSPRRLRTIYRVNMQTAYAAGAWEQIQDTKRQAPLLMYDAVDDNRTRDEHAAWDGTILPVDDPWWSYHMPPNGWNCRCSVIQLGEAQAEELGYTPGAKAPATPMREYTNPRTGEVVMVPKGIDPGFAYNPGQQRSESLQRSLQEKQKGFDDGR